MASLEGVLGMVNMCVLCTEDSTMGRCRGRGDGGGVDEGGGGARRQASIIIIRITVVLNAS